MKTTIEDYQIIHHGIMLPDYFQGCGISGTDYTHVATGIGQTAREAFDDACEQLACDGIETDSIHFVGQRGRPLTVAGYLKSQGIVQDENDDSSYFYVSVRVQCAETTLPLVS